MRESCRAANLHRQGRQSYPWTQGPPQHTGEAWALASSALPQLSGSLHIQTTTVITATTTTITETTTTVTTATTTATTTTKTTTTTTTV